MAQAHEFMLFVHRQVVPCLPPEEKWDLAAQIRRSSKSIAANIAEGYGRFYYQDNVRFCYNGRGSLLETINHLIAARDLGYISADLYLQARQCGDGALRVLNGYIGWLKKTRQGANEPDADHPTTNHQSLIDEPPIDQSTN